MLKTLTYKQRNRLLLPGVIVLLWLSYQYAISNTMELYGQVSKLESQMANNSPDKLARLKNKLKKLNSKMSNYKFDDTRDKEYILGITSDFCAKNKLTLSEFPEANIVEDETSSLETLTITAQGNYIGLLKLLDFLEHQNKIGRISSVQFYTQFDHKNQLSRLYSKIYIQNIRLKENK
jgi:hypothetical protein